MFIKHPPKKKGKKRRIFALFQLHYWKYKSADLVTGEKSELCFFIRDFNCTQDFFTPQLERKHNNNQKQEKKKSTRSSLAPETVRAGLCGAKRGNVWQEIKWLCLTLCQSPTC